MDPTTATEICKRLHEENINTSKELRDAIFKSYFGYRGDKDPATLPVQDSDTPLFVDMTIPHPRDWEELWERAQSYPKFIGTNT